MKDKKQKIIDECQRQSENCLYTSTTLFIWLKILRFTKCIFLVVPLVLGSLSSWNLLTSTDLNSIKVFTSIASFLAGLMPTIYLAVKIDSNIDKTTKYSSVFKNLQDRFRQAALIDSNNTIEEFENKFEELMQKMEEARCESLTPPEWVFKRSQKKVQSGDYNFDYDE